MKKNGFTLIELLAVILILGIIALIAVPTVNIVIGQVKIGAAKQSVETYISEVDKQIVLNQFDDNNLLEDGEYSVPLESKYGITVKGDIPDSGWIKIKDGKVDSYYIIINGYVVSSDGTLVSLDSLYSNEDVFLLDLKDTILLESGDIDTSTGSNIDNKRRVRTKDFYEVKFDKYDVTITDGYVLSIYEYDSDKSYLSNVSFSKNDTYKPSNKVKYFKVTLKATSSSVEKSFSFGQWGKVLVDSNFKAKVSVGDFNRIYNLNNSVKVTVDKSASAEEIQNALINDSSDLANLEWDALVSNGTYNISISNLDLNNRKTYYISNNGDDSNSGLTSNFPKKSLEQFSNINNVNILIESGMTYNVSSGFSVGNNVTIMSYGNGDRPTLSFYRDLNSIFSKVDGYDNLYVTSLKNYSDIYTGSGGKDDCNIGQLVINGEVNWKRKVYSSSESFTPELLTGVKDNNSWAIDTANANLYIYTIYDPNSMSFKYAPPTTALSAKGTSNITIQGIEITGAGLHAINFANTENVLINGCSFKYIGGSILTSAGTRYGNAVQIWDSATNILVTNNIANWIFDTCYTNQGSSTSMMLKNVVFKNNIGARSQWGLETWGDGGAGYENIEYAYNLLYHMGDITNMNTKMQCSSSGHLYGEKDASDYISYRYGYTYHQGANLAIWSSTESYLPSIHNNIFWGTNRYLVIGSWFSDTIDYYNLYNNLFYEDYHLSYDTTPALYKFKTSSNKYIASLSGITSNTTNTEVIHKVGIYDNTNEMNQMKNFIEEIIK